MLSKKLAPETGDTDETAEFVTRYTLGAVKHDTRRHGSLVSSEPEDVLQQTNLELFALHGADYLNKLGQLLQADSDDEAKSLLKQAVRRAIDKLQGTFRKRRCRRLPQEVQLETLHSDKDGNSWESLKEQGRAVVPSAVGLTDLVLDLRQVQTGFTDLEKAVWRGLQEGRTTRELGAQLGMSHQRVAELRKQVLHQVAACIDRQDAKAAPWLLLG